MTEPTPDLSLHPALAALAEAEPVTITAEPGTRLEQLHAAYDAAKAAADKASDELKVITDALKAELTAAGAGHDRLELTSNVGPTLRLSRVESWRLDSARMKREDPYLYVKFAKKSESWTLRKVGGR